MELFLMTRGTPRSHDYRWFPGNPQEWWRFYEDHLIAEGAALMVERDDSGWRAFLSGIPSARRDAVGTPIRYSLALVESGNDPCGASWTGVILAWLTDRARLGRVLDEQWTGAEVEEWYSGDGPSTEALGSAITAAGSRERAPQGSYSGIQIGGLAAPGAEEAAKGVLAELASGQVKGRLLVLNGADVQVDAERLVNKYGREGTVTLILDASGTPLRKVDLEPSSPPPNGDDPGKGPASSRRKRILLAALAGALAIAVVVVLVKSQARRGSDSESHHSSTNALTYRAT